MPSSLQIELDAFKASWAERVPDDVRAVMAADIDRLAASGIVKRALKAGDALPAITLIGADGRPVNLGEVAAKGPLVLTFYRGGWCPYCNLELRAFQKELPDIKALGATLVAVSPETPDNTLSTAEKNDLAFPVLSDPDGKLADALGIRFELTPEIKAIYARFGHDLPSHNGDGRWSLPIPATYVVERGGRTALAHVEPDYRKRLEPSAVIAALRAILGVPVRVKQLQSNAAAK